MSILLGLLALSVLAVVVIAWIKPKWFGQTAHERIQTVCTGAQTIVVLGGIGFAIVELNHWTADRDQQRKEKTLELLSELDGDLRAAVEFVDQAWTSSFASPLPWMRMGPQVSAEDFDTQTKPLLAHFRVLERCIRHDECDRNMAASEVCSLLQTYHLAWMDTRPVSARPSKPEEKWRGAPTVLLNDCPSVRERLSQFYEFAPVDAAQAQ